MTSNSLQYREQKQIKRFERKHSIMLTYKMNKVKIFYDINHKTEKPL